MTVEAATKVKEPYGLTGERTREVEKTSIVEYRTAHLTQGAMTSFKPDNALERVFGLDYGPRDEHGHVQTYTPKSWALVNGEDSVQIDKVSFNTGTPRLAGQITLYREEINAANITTEDGETRLTWRETQPGDYPEAVLFETSDAEVIVFYEEPRVQTEAA